MSQAAPDYLTRFVAGTGSDGAAESIQARGAEAVLGLYRLVKIAMIHSVDNDAVGQTLDQTLAVLLEFSALAGGRVTLTFVHDTTLVCGKLLRASRSVFEWAAELGALLSKCGVSEIGFSPELTRADLRATAVVITSALRDGAEVRLDAAPETVHMAKLDAVLLDRLKKGQTQRTLDYYASALVVMRRFMDDLAAGTTVVPHKVKRLAQGLVALAETEGPALLGLTALANAHRDDAGRAVQSAILAIAVAREFTSERPAVVRMAMTALLCDVGRVKLAGKEGRDRLVQLADDVEIEVPAMSTAVSLSIGGVNAQTALHTVIVHETTSLEREALLGPLYGGSLAPLLQAKVLQVVRAMMEKLAPRDNSRSATVMEALTALAANPALDRTIVRLLVKAVGLVPIGSVVELETGEWAVVAGPSAERSALDRPKVRVVMSRRGEVVEPPEDWDLGSPPPGVTYPRIARLLPKEETRFNVARALTRY